MKKTKLLACALAVMCCIAAFSMSAFAADGGYYQSNEDGDNTPPSSIDSITVSTEGVKLPDKDDSTLTPDGNLTLIDDILQADNYSSDEGVTVGNKQFITVQSKSGNYFYIVIDRSGDTENVYFLNLVDEADLMALMEDGETDETSVCTCMDKCVAGDVDTSCPVCAVNMSECTGKEAVTEPDTTTEPDTEPTDTEPKKSSGSGLLLVLLILALAGGGAFYYFKVVKNKPKTKGATDLDEYAFEDDEEYETEDESEASEKPDNDTEE